MIGRIITFVLALALAGTAFGQEKKRIEKAADLPRFTYKVDGKLDDDRPRRREVQGVRARSAPRHRIGARAVRHRRQGDAAPAARRDRATRLSGGPLRRSAEGPGAHPRSQEKPADKLLSGLPLRAMITAERKVGNRTSDAYRAEVGRMIARELAAMPYDVVQNEVKEGKAGAEIAERGAGARLHPRSDAADGRQGGRAELGSRARARQRALPHRCTCCRSRRRWSTPTARYLAAHKVDKPDIWAARDVQACPPGKGTAPVSIAIWDSGVDTALFDGPDGQGRRRQACGDRVRQVREPGRRRPAADPAGAARARCRR